jgi:hypothetical protein
MAGPAIDRGAAHSSLTTVRITVAPDAGGEWRRSLREVLAMTRRTAHPRVLPVEGVARERVIEIAAIDGAESAGTVALTASGRESALVRIGVARAAFPVRHGPVHGDAIAGGIATQRKPCRQMAAIAGDVAMFSRERVIRRVVREPGSAGPFSSVVT